LVSIDTDTMSSSQRFSRTWSGGTSNGTGNARKGEELYEKLRTYEARRRLAYSTKLDSISLYWKSYCDLLSASLSETGRAQRIVLGTSHAYAMYAEAMQGIFDDVFLDNKGNVAKDRQKKKALANKKVFGGDSVKVSKVSVLKEVRDAQKDLSSRFQESAKNMEEEIAELIGSLLDTTKTSFDTMGRLGSSIIDELEKTEKEVTTAWNNYLNCKSDVVGETKSDETPVDPWVVEMQYRVAVTYQNVAWEKGNEELKKLFVKVKEEEINRRMNLREFLVAFAQRQQRLFLSLPDIQTKVLEELAGKETSRDEMYKIVTTSVEERALKYKKAAMGLDLVNDVDDVDFNLESPLTSDLLSKAKVVLRQGQGGDWTLSLAVMSADSFLHMFDIDSPKVKLTTSPEVAFTLLKPPLISPDINNIKSGISNFGRSWSESLTPTVSMILAKCRVKKLDDNSFEILESISPAGASKFALSKRTRRRIQIQTPTKEETDDWIQILTA